MIDNGLVYFMGNKQANLVKIGMCKTQDGLAKRMETVRTNFPYKLQLFWALGCCDELKATTVERQMHDLFANYQVNGEWFQFEVWRHVFCVVDILNDRPFGFGTVVACGWSTYYDLLLYDAKEALENYEAQHQMRKAA